MSNVQPPQEKDRDRVVSLQDLACTNSRMQYEHFVDLNECSDDRVAAIVREQCLGNYI